jgi:hypothetical protein
LSDTVDLRASQKSPYDQPNDSGPCLETAALNSCSYALYFSGKPTSQLTSVYQKRYILAAFGEIFQDTPIRMKSIAQRSDYSTESLKDIPILVY